MLLINDLRKVHTSEMLNRSPLRRSTKPLRRSAMKKRPRKSSVKVLPDGREVLRGGAYKDRCREVYERDGGRCQMPSADYYHTIEAKLTPEEIKIVLSTPLLQVLKCLKPVGFERAIFDHLEKRSLGRDDRAANLRTAEVCCHNRRHELERLAK